MSSMFLVFAYSIYMHIRIVGSFKEKKNYCFPLPTSRPSMYCFLKLFQKIGTRAIHVFISINMITTGHTLSFNILCVY